MKKWTFTGGEEVRQAWLKDVITNQPLMDIFVK